MVFPGKGARVVCVVDSGFFALCHCRRADFGEVTRPARRRRHEDNSPTRLGGKPSWAMYSLADEKEEACSRPSTRCGTRNGGPPGSSHSSYTGRAAGVKALVSEPAARRVVEKEGSGIQKTVVPPESSVRGRVTGWLPPRLVSAISPPPAADSPGSSTSSPFTSSSGIGLNGDRAPPYCWP